MKASGFPASSISSTETKFRGRVANITGERTFADWKITLWNKSDHNIRQYFEGWQDSISGAGTNLRTGEYGDIYRDFAVLQLSTEGKVTAGITIHGGFVTELGEITLDNDSSGIETFDATIKYQWWDRMDSAALAAIPRANTTINQLVAGTVGGATSGFAAGGFIGAAVGGVSAAFAGGTSGADLSF